MDLMRRIDKLCMLPMPDMTTCIINVEDYICEADSLGLSPDESEDEPALRRSL